jgi:hypothetical protein
MPFLRPLLNHDLGAFGLRGKNVQAPQKGKMTFSMVAARKLRRLRRTFSPVEMIELLILMILAIGLLNGAAAAIPLLFPRH